MRRVQSHPALDTSWNTLSQWRLRPVSSVWELTESFPPGFYETTVLIIKDVLVELGFDDQPELLRLAEHLFADQFAGRPSVTQVQEIEAQSA